MQHCSPLLILYECQQYSSPVMDVAHYLYHSAMYSEVSNIRMAPLHCCNRTNVDFASSATCIFLLEDTTTMANLERVLSDLKKHEKGFRFVVIVLSVGQGGLDGNAVLPRFANALHEKLQTLNGNPMLHPAYVEPSWFQVWSQKLWEVLVNRNHKPNSTDVSPVKQRSLLTLKTPTSVPETVVICFNESSTLCPKLVAEIPSISIVIVTGDTDLGSLQLAYRKAIIVLCEHGSHEMLEKFLSWLHLPFDPPLEFTATQVATRYDVQNPLGPAIAVRFLELGALPLPLHLCNDDSHCVESIGKIFRTAGATTSGGNTPIPNSHSTGFDLATSIGDTPLQDHWNCVPSLLILYATVTGNSESIAFSLYNQSASAGFKAKVAAIDQFESLELATARVAIFIVSTTGDGDTPPVASTFLRFLRTATKTKALADLNYAVLALGDTNYTAFCKAGKLIDKKIEEAGAKRFLPIAMADEAVGLDETVEPWRNGLWDALRERYIPKDDSYRQSPPIAPLSAPSQSIPMFGGHMLVLFGSMTGNSERIATAIAQEARLKHDFTS
eukprot:PhF_6_TR40526/c0_g1_i2/m.60705/K00597/MTRR; methionine synthase reductase